MAEKKENLWEFAKSAPWQIKLKLGTVMLVGLGSVSFSSYVIWRIWSFQSPPVAPTREVAKIENPATTPSPEAEQFRFEYDLKKISMPIADRNGRRTGTAQFSVALDLPTNQSLHWMQLNRAKLLTITFDVGAKYTFEDLEASGGLEKFKTDLKDAYHEAFGVYAPNQVALRDWVTN